MHAFPMINEGINTMEHTFSDIYTPGGIYEIFPREYKFASFAVLFFLFIYLVIFFFRTVT